MKILLVFNKKTLYIFRDTTYSDINYLLGFVGQDGINLVRGSGQKAHVLSALELRFMLYLKALKGNNFKSISKLNNSEVLPKIFLILTIKDKVKKDILTAYTRFYLKYFFYKTNQCRVDRRLFWVEEILRLYFFLFINIYKQPCGGITGRPSN